MKKLILSLGILPLIFACNSQDTGSSEPKVEENSFRVSGTFQGNNQVILGKVTPQRLVPVDTFQMDTTTGYFEFDGSIDAPRFYTLVFNDGNTVMILAKGGENIKITYDSTAAARYTVSGSEGSSLIRESNIMLDSAYLTINELEAEFQSAFESETEPSEETREAYQARFQKVLEEYKGELRAFIEKNQGSPATLVALYQRIGRMPVFEVNKDFEVFEMVAEGLKNSMPNADFTNNITQIVDGARSTKIGSPAPDFTLANPEGELVSLSDFKGQYVLVDFWASWCRPCRAENPNIVRAYQKYKDKGFTVLGVSLDGTQRQQSPREDWLAAIEQDELTWTHISDLKGWETSVRGQYNFDGIPFSVLVGPDGKILAKNLRGPELHSKLEELL